MSQEKTVYGVCAAILAIVLLQAFLPEREPPTAPPAEPPQPCIGTPIVVDYPYTGTINEPHACKTQCTDKVQHYISYSNGKATQCELLPGCNDIGEDRGITCEPQSSSSLE